jgi:hypothetical protein
MAKLTAKELASFKKEIKATVAKEIRNQSKTIEKKVNAALSKLKGRTQVYP